MTESNQRSSVVYAAAIAADIALVPAADAVAVCDAPEQGAFDFVAAVNKMADVGATWVIGIPELGAALEDYATQGVSLFTVDELPTLVFATNGELAKGKSRVIVSAGQIGALAQQSEGDEVEVDKTARKVTRLLKTEEERFVLGVVLVPETADSQGDIYSADEIRKAAHGYMETSAGTLGKQHKEIVTGKLKVLESYLAPVDFAIGEEQISQGTWLLGIRVVDDELWEGVKDGSFTGFSIGGAAYRKPETN